MTKIELYCFPHTEQKFKLKVEHIEWLIDHKIKYHIESNGIIDADGHTDARFLIIEDDDDAIVFKLRFGI